MPLGKKYMDTNYIPSGGTASPFWRSCEEYRRAGWLQVIPCKGKRPLVAGKHGRNHTSVSTLDLQRWAKMPRLADAQIAVGMPWWPDGTCVIGLDLDDPSKHQAQGDGVKTLHELESRLGALPATWTNGHNDTPYRHRFYRTKLAEYSPLGAGIDLLTPHNRYAVVWPSVHASGEVYGWKNPSGEDCGIPTPEEIPFLPESWAGRLIRGGSGLKAVDESDTHESRRRGEGLDAGQEMCPWMNQLAQRWVTDPYMGRSCRHDGWLRLCMLMLNAQAGGHKGAVRALRALAPRFVSLISNRADAATGMREAESVARWALNTVELPATIPADPCTTDNGFEVLTAPTREQIEETARMIKEALQ